MRMEINYFYYNIYQSTFLPTSGTILQLMRLGERLNRLSIFSARPPTLPLNSTDAIKETHSPYYTVLHSGHTEYSVLLP